MGTQVDEGGEELVVGVTSEVVDLDVADVALHVLGNDAVDRDLTTLHFEMEQIACGVATDAEFDYRTCFATQGFEYDVVVDLLADEEGVIDGDDAVAGENADLLGRTTRDDLDNHDGVLLDVELDAHATERAFELFGDSGHVFARDIG